MHNFLTSQPDLNFHNPAVQDAALESVRFWLERGVDGFRLDVINFCFHDAQLRDNPARTEFEYNPAVNDATPYARQIHRFDKSQPDNLQFLRKLRGLLNAFPNIASVGEIGDDNTLERITKRSNPMWAQKSKTSRSVAASATAWPAMSNCWPNWAPPSARLTDKHRSV